MIIMVTIFLFFFIIVIIAKIGLLSKTSKFPPLRWKLEGVNFCLFLPPEPFSVKLKFNII